eukprot:1067386-Pelagomonas_calceolata.AAC.1
MRFETFLAVYDALLSDERVTLDSLGFLEDLLSTFQGGDGIVIMYARRLCRYACAAEGMVIVSPGQSMGQHGVCPALAQEPPSHTGMGDDSTEMVNPQLRCLMRKLGFKRAEHAHHLVLPFALLRVAEDALKQGNMSSTLASLLSLRFYLCNAEHKQYWRLLMGEDGRKALWSGQPAGGLHQLPSTPEDVLETDASGARACVR